MPWPNAPFTRHVFAANSAPASMAAWISFFSSMASRKAVAKESPAPRVSHRIHQLRLLGVILLSVIDQEPFPPLVATVIRQPLAFKSLTELFDLFLRRVAAGGKGDIHLGPDGLNIIL